MHGLPVHLTNFLGQPIEHVIYLAVWPRIRMHQNALIYQFHKHLCMQYLLVFHSCPTPKNGKRSKEHLNNFLGQSIEHVIPGSMAKNKNAPERPNLSISQTFMHAILTGVRFMSNS